MLVPSYLEHQLVTFIMYNHYFYILFPLHFVHSPYNTICDLAFPNTVQFISHMLSSFTPSPCASQEEPASHSWKHWYSRKYSRECIMTTSYIATLLKLLFNWTYTIMPYVDICYDVYDVFMPVLWHRVQVEWYQINK